MNEKWKAFLDDHEFRKLVVGFVLSTLVGGLLTFWFSFLSAARSEREQLRQADLRAASDVFTDISRSLDKRLYRTRLLLWGYQEHVDDSEIANRKKSYAEAVQEWSENLNRTYAQMERYFGRELRDFLEGYLTGEFRCISARIRVPSRDLRAIETDIDELNRQVYRFNAELLRRIQAGDVGVQATTGQLTFPPPKACSGVETRATPTSGPGK
jgi:hypothetical protein